jgi:PPOX class probable FMN-dependent enzyme
MVWSMKIPWLEPFRTAELSEEGRQLILSLATIGVTGDPKVRSVICRRIDERGQIWIASDARSGKHRELHAYPRASAVAWFPAVREQFRFDGPARILDSATDIPDRVELWRALPPTTRAMFFWPAPGTPRVSTESFVASSEALEPPPTFEILVLQPIRVEHLVLTTHPHQRRRWERGVQWTMQELNP